MKTTLIVLFISVISVIAKKIHRIPKGKEKKASKIKNFNLFDVIYNLFSFILQKLRGVTFKTKRITQRGSGSWCVNMKFIVKVITDLKCIIDLLLSLITIKPFTIS